MSQCQELVTMSPLWQKGLCRSVKGLRLLDRTNASTEDPKREARGSSRRHGEGVGAGERHLKATLLTSETEKGFQVKNCGQPGEAGKGRNGTIPEAFRGKQS